MKQLGSREKMTTRIWCLSWIALLTNCGRADPPRPPPNDEQLAPFSEPTIDISPPDASGTFRFAFCGHIKTLPLVSRIEVSPPGQKVGSLPHTRYCLWKKESGDPLSSEWRYGSRTEGSKVVGACEPFHPGASYEVLVDGSGSGSLQFKVAPDGTMIVTRPSCPPRTQ